MVQLISDIRGGLLQGQEEWVGINEMDFRLFIQGLICERVQGGEREDEMGSKRGELLWGLEREQNGRIRCI